MADRPSKCLSPRYLTQSRPCCRQLCRDRCVPICQIIADNCETSRCDQVRFMTRSNKILGNCDLFESSTVSAGSIEQAIAPSSIGDEGNHTLQISGAS